MHFGVRQIGFFKSDIQNSPGHADTICAVNKIVFWEKFGDNWIVATISVLDGDFNYLALTKAGFCQVYYVFYRIKTLNIQILSAWFANRLLYPGILVHPLARSYPINSITSSTLSDGMRM